eukprot:m51a1_g12148 hypothetical protein (138) ;mRNA; r:284-869
MESLRRSVNDLFDLFDSQALQRRIQTALDSVRWTEPWIVALVLAHALVLVLTLRWRRSSFSQVVLVTLFLFAVGTSNAINVWCRDHWSEFSSRSYCDRNGSFVLVFHTIPFLFHIVVALLQHACCGASGESGRKKTD